MKCIKIFVCNYEFMNIDNFRKIKLQTTDYSCIISRTTRNNCSLYLKVNEQDPIEIDDWVIDEEDEDAFVVVISGN